MNLYETRKNKTSETKIVYLHLHTYVNVEQGEYDFPCVPFKSIKPKKIYKMLVVQLLVDFHQSRSRMWTTGSEAAREVARRAVEAPQLYLQTLQPLEVQGYLYCWGVSKILYNSFSLQLRDVLKVKPQAAASKTWTHKHTECTMSHKKIKIQKGGG